MSSSIPTIDPATLVYKNEKGLFIISAVISAVLWLIFLIATHGAVIIYILLFFIIYLFAQSALISWIKGNGVQITAEQFPELYARFSSSCQRLEIKTQPDAYILQSGGVLNAFATRFLGRNFVVLYSNVIDALAAHPDAVSFYIGHELGHIKRRHIQWAGFLSLANLLPILGAAQSRAHEYTCDNFGAACCEDKQSALYGIAVLAAGEKSYAALNIHAYLKQLKSTTGFWMSFHELISDYPWLVKRAARINNPEYPKPSRHPLAWLLAIFIPRIGGGGASGVIVVVAVIGILAAIAVPAYQDYLSRANLSTAAFYGDHAARAVSEYYNSKHELPSSLAETGFRDPTPSSVSKASVDSETGEIRLLMNKPLEGKALLWVPSLDADKHASWKCTSEDIRVNLLPMQCR
ncbi:M48 family metalloprotease [Aquirhabdus sp.]|uniref:M48 family metalloprotease n=1 Tax=Aquirhabdus sp. TaxID=2824160 RepID=UPI00396C47C7